MASNSKPFVSFTAGESPLNFPLSGSVPIRAPLTLDDSDFDVSSENSSLSDTPSASSHSDNFHTPTSLADPEAHYASQLEEDDDEEEGCFEVDVGDPLLQLPSINDAPLRVMPFAHLSTHDDDDDDEDDDVLGVVRVPEENLVGAPRIKVVDFEEDNDESFMFMNSIPVTQSLLANKFTFFNDTGSDIDEEKVEDEHGVDEDLGIGVAFNGRSNATDEDVMSQYYEDSLNNEQFGKVDETDTLIERKMEVDTSEATHMVEGTSIMFGESGLLKSNAECYIDSSMLEENTSVDNLQEQNSQIPSMKCELVSDAFAENIKYSTTTQGTACNGSQDVGSDQESELEKLVSMTPSVIDSEAKLHDSSASFESNDDVCEGKKIQCVESSELFDPILLQECTYLENDLSKTVLGAVQEDELNCDYHSNENMETLDLGDTVIKEATVELNTVSQELKRDGSASNGDVEGLMAVDLDQFMDQISALSFLLGSKGFGKNSQEEQPVRNSHGNMNLPKDEVKSQIKYVDIGGESDGNMVRVTSADESSVIFHKDPASFSSLPNFDAQAGFQHNISEKEKEKIKEIQTISVKFFRLFQRINLSFEDSLVSKVLFRLVADIGRRSNQEFVIRSAKASAKKLEENSQDDLDFSLNFIVLGKSGVGKSATINSIFGDMKVMTNAFEPATTSVKEVSGTIDGVKVRILDTPGLRSSMKEQAYNRKILSSVKRYMQKVPPDFILYVDRVDAQARDLNDLLILRSITGSLSPSIWKHAIVTLTHAASTLLDGPSGSPLGYEVFVAQKSYVVQQSITKAVGDLCQLDPNFMCPVSLVENNPLCRKNICGDCVLPDVLRWRSQLLALCISLKILSEVSSVSQPQTLFDHWKHLFFQDHSQPLSHPFSSLLHSPAYLKFSANWN